jgi:outer membrane beta-barrel protein
MQKLKVRFIESLLISIFVPSVAFGDTPQVFYDIPKLTAVQNRPYYLNEDVSFELGFLPSDAFNKGYSFGASYTHYFSEYLGWEVVNANYVFNAPTGLKNDLLNNFSAQVQNVGFNGILDYITYYATTNLVYTPLYTKSLLFNRTLVRGETSFVAGVGGANFAASGIKALVSLGFYLRFFTSASQSIKLDFRDNVYFEQGLGAVNAFSLGFAYSIQLGGAPVAPTHIEGEND